MKVVGSQIASAAQFAASFLLVNGLCGPALSATPDAGAAQSSDRVWEMIKQGQPGRPVQIPPGTYDVLKLDGMKFPRGVTVTSADKDRPAIFKGLNITSSQGLTFKSIEVIVNPGTGFAVMLGSDNDVHFDHVNLHGAAVGDGNAIMVRNSSDVSVTSSEVHHLGTGINHLNSDHVTFADNFIHDIQSDGVRGGGSSFVTISGNRFTDFYPKPGDHPDTIQFWTTGTKGPAHHLNIRDNVYVRGKGDPVQGIFVGSETQAPYEDVNITGNVIIGGMYHGISLGYGTRVTVENNIVQGYSDMTSWIMLKNTTDSAVRSNQATDYKLDEENHNLEERANKGLRKARKGDDSLAKTRWPADR